MNESLSCPDRLSAVIDLDAIVHNWQMMEEMAPHTAAMPVLKADGYGHGIVPVAKALFHAGCTAIFTASLEEAIQIKQDLPDLEIAFFDGPQDGDIDAIKAFNLITVLNSPTQLDVMINAAKAHDHQFKVMLHLDTGMNRLGFNAGEAALLSEREDLGCLDWLLILSHLAMADEPDDPMNAEQKAAFDHFLETRPAILAGVKASLSATAGIMLGSGYHYDVTRPGIGIYGMAPAPDVAPDQVAKLRPAISLRGRVLQIRDANAGESVGYGKSCRLNRPCRLATIGGGYADGIMRQLSNQGDWMINGHNAPIVGRVSMDVHVVDITDCPHDSLKVGDMVSFIETADDVHMIAKNSATIAHDVLTRLGLRAKRHYAGVIVKELDL